MEWWNFLGWVIAALLGLPAAIYYSFRFKSDWDAKKERDDRAKAEISAAMTRIARFAEDCQSSFGGQLPDVTPIRKLRRDLSELKSLVREYDVWRHESWNTVRDGIIATVHHLPQLSEPLGRFFANRREWVEGREYTQGEVIYKAVYKGELTPALVREAILKDQWGDSLRDVLDGRDFHQLVQQLQRLQDRKCVKMFRDVRTTLIYKAQAMIKEL